MATLLDLRPRKGREGEAAQEAAGSGSMAGQGSSRQPATGGGGGGSDGRWRGRQRRAVAHRETG